MYIYVYLTPDSSTDHYLLIWCVTSQAIMKLLKKNPHMTRASDSEPYTRRNTIHYETSGKTRTELVDQKRTPKYIAATLEYMIARENVIKSRNITNPEMPPYKQDSIN